MPSLRDSRAFPTFTRHFRAGLSHAAASRLEFGRLRSTALPEIQFSPTTKALKEKKGFIAALKALRHPKSKLFNNLLKPAFCLIGSGTAGRGCGKTRIPRCSA